MGNDRVLVGITTRNRADILPQAIQSALDQNYQSLQVKVVDDASTDTTDEIQQQFPKVIWEKKSPAVGYRQNRNEMMQSEGISYYVSLDDDAWFLTGDEIEIAVQRMRDNPQIAAIGFDILSPDAPLERDRDVPVPANMFIGCGHILRLSAVKEVGYYVVTPGAYGGEEKDLCLRLLDAGYEIEKLPGVHVWHDKAWSDRDWFGTHKSGVCNDLCLCLMRFPFQLLILMLPVKVIRHCVFATRNPRFVTAAIAGIGLFLRNVVRIFRRRKPVSSKAIKIALGKCP